MYIARLTCSDPSCAHDRTAEVASLAELEALACDCGCALEVVGWPEWSDDEELAEAILVRLRGERERERAQSRRLPDAA